MSIVNLSAQDSIPRLSFEFGVNRHQFAMDTVNNFIDAAINASVKFLDTRIESGSSYNFKLGYTVSNFIECGVFGTYQSGKSEYKPLYPMGNNPPVEGFYSITTDNLSGGIYSTFWINKVIHKRPNSFLHRLKYGFSANIGYARGNFRQLTYAPINEFAVSRYRVFSNESFLYQFEIKTEYLLTKKHLFSSIGFNIGYQGFKTDYVKTQLDENELSNGGTKIMLDFSGFYYGIYLKLAR
jgi:hypothetical protein